MSDLDDFFALHPTPNPPPKETDHNAPSVRTSGSMRLVDNTVCRVGCTEHNHNQPEFRPQPDLDEVGVGWTVQHVPRDPHRSVVPFRCVVCWAETDDLLAHVCPVMEVVRG